MSTLFPKWTNLIPYAAPVVGALALGGASFGYYYWFTPEYWRVGYEPKQPVDYSHQLHAGTLGIDCRYCHTKVEQSPHSNVPDTATCMTCHTGSGEQAYLNSTLWSAHKSNANLVAIRTAYASGEPVLWRRVHKVPDYAHFNHAVHLKAGVSCYSCHGRVDQMAVVRQEHSLSMSFCLECHRRPEKSLVDTSTTKVTDLAAVQAALSSADQAKRGAELARQKQLEPPQTCGACHY